MTLIEFGKRRIRQSWWVLLVALSGCAGSGPAKLPALEEGMARIQVSRSGSIVGAGARVFVVDANVEDGDAALPTERAPRLHSFGVARFGTQLFVRSLRGYAELVAGPEPRDEGIIVHRSVKLMDTDRNTFEVGGPFYEGVEFNANIICGAGRYEDVKFCALRRGQSVAWNRKPGTVQLVAVMHDYQGLAFNIGRFVAAAGRTYRIRFDFSTRKWELID